jgi:hypothetical protein
LLVIKKLISLKFVNGVLKEQWEYKLYQRQ